LLHLLDELDEALARGVGGRGGLPDSGLAEKPLEGSLFRVLRIDAQHMDAFARRELETGEDVDLPVGLAGRGALERGDAAHVVVVRDGQHRDTELDRLGDHGPGVFFGVAAADQLDR